MNLAVCKICGEVIEYEPRAGYHAVYCSDSCRQESIRMQNEDKIMKKRISYRRRTAPPNKLDEIMKECDKLGISYSEWKKKQILDGVERIKV